MDIWIDDNAGFCFGVVRAIDTAEHELAQHGKLYCLGDIVHNNAEVQRLKEKGLCVVDDLQTAVDGRQSAARVLIRAHGEPPATYERARTLGITLVDATCPIVLALQQRIRKGYEEMKRLSPQGQVVIFGKPGHAEVIGLCGQTDNTALVVSTPDDLEGIDFGRPVRLYSQTTKSKEEYQRLTENIRARMAEGGEEKLADGTPKFVAYNTICNRVANRATQLETFARSVDMVLFVSGRGSSNGHYLYEYCKSVQPATMLVSEVGGLRKEDFEGVERVGITGATSTPRWLMESVAERLRSMN